MNEQGLSEKEIFSYLENAKSEDTDYYRVLSSMCTHPHKIAVEANRLFIEANLGDLGLFAGASRLEQEVVGMLGELLHAPSIDVPFGGSCESSACGYLTTGGTESNIQAVRGMKNLVTTGKKELKGAPNIVIPESAHFSFDKVADMMGIEVRRASLDSEFRVDMASIESLIDANTIGLIGIAGNTEFGQIDPIDKLSEIALENELFLHIDAAFGGFVIPFLEKPQPFDFKLPGVTSIAVDPHKMGLSTIPSGALLFRSASFLDSLKVNTPYLTTKAQFTLTGTRSGASAAATCAVMKYLGNEGYRKNVQYCMQLTEKLVIEARKIGFEPLLEPVMNVVALKVPNPDFVREQMLERFGWNVSITRTPRALRLVLMPHNTLEDIEIFVQDLKEVTVEI
ncbi:TPA: tyrosine decarboxylase MfnA [Methanosarcina acetivorans]|uniref:Probable L-tyrosine/L-aspartate decarboxylase n=2 Tax=Methanosarcina acetivorans TaxID=2214 RepID=MFNA_METAC|nr:tyrosine decarboxylase MfnA [Methanosarcina acetivorans]Q8TUQ9.1 RecName: Full=Probable L-tyrosine/L-aspartate decarboxylase; Short=TDC/ADC [Methanosarcina acetivorans C2A]AAM03460.1 pyridoxal-dependent decarboxylase [Methanosarcina acetivorans C2A]HIH93907.1 tyrosine decarboxylase MfnA [Methanosarcina acetivorans]